MSKEEAIEILSEMWSEYNLFGDEEEATRYYVLSWAIRAMNAEPVRHGHWIYTPTEPLGYICSECGKSSCSFNYCSNCGAKMDEVTEDGLLVTD